MPQTEHRSRTAADAAPASTHRKILAVGFSSKEFRHLAPLLERASFELDRFPDPTGALELLGPIPFHMILVRYPLSKMDMVDFLARIREPGARSRSSSLVILADHGHMEDAADFVSKGANRVIELEPSALHIETVVADLLNIAPRRSARFFARIQARLDGVPRSVQGVIRNTSATGLLMETDQMINRGTEVSFELTLPGGGDPVRGRAEVVRHALSEKEEMQGIALRILSFNGNCGEQYRDFLNRQVH